MAIYHVDLENGNDANDGSTWALAKKTLPVTGDDEYRIAETQVYSLGQNAQWTNKSKIVTLSSALTKNIDDAIGNTWSLSANVTGSAYTTSRKLGASAQNFNEAAAFTTGKLAWKQLPATEDYSAYSAVSFWWNGSHAVNVSEKKYRLCLCSDTNGNVIVNSFPIDDIMMANSNTVMFLKNGSPLGSSINSVAIYCDVDTSAAVSIRINNIMACNDFSLRSLIGKSNQQGSDFFGIQSIVDKTITIDGGDLAPTTGRGYFGDTENVIIYRRDSIPVYTKITYYTFTGGAMYRFGWNIDTNQQTGETWFDGLCFNNSLINKTILNKFPTVENVGISRFGAGFYCRDFFNLSNIQVTNCSSSYVFRIDSNGFTVDGINVHNNTASASCIEIRAGHPSPLRILNFTVNSNIASAADNNASLNITSCFTYYENLQINNNGSFGVVIFTETPQGRGLFGYKNTFKNVSAIDNLHASFKCFGSENTIINYDTNSTTDSIAFKNYFINSLNVINYGFDVHQYNMNGVEGAHRVSVNSLSYMEWQTTIKHGTDIGAWKIVGLLPLEIFKENNQMVNIFKIADIAVEVGVPVLIGAMVYGYQNIPQYYGCRLLIRAIYTDVIANDCEAIIPAGEDWSNIAFSVTPIKSGVLRLEVQVFNAIIYIGSISVTT